MINEELKVTFRADATELSNSTVSASKGLETLTKSVANTNKVLPQVAQATAAAAKGIEQLGAVTQNTSFASIADKFEEARKRVHDSVDKMVADALSIEPPIEKATDALVQLGRKPLQSIKNLAQTIQSAKKDISGFSLSAIKAVNTAPLVGSSNAATKALVKNANASNQAGQALSNLGRVAQDAPFGFIGIQNNLNPLLESFQRLRKESGSNIGALKALGSSLLGAGGIGFALSAVSSLFLLFGDRMFKSSNAADKLKEKIDAAKKATDDFVDSLSEVRKVRLEGDQNAQKELINADLLYKASQNQNLALGERKKAVDALQDQYPKYFANIKDEVILAGGAASAYNKLKEAIIASSRARAGIEALDQAQRDHRVGIDQARDAQTELTAAKKAELAINEKFDRLTTAQLAKEGVAARISRELIPIANARIAAQEKLNKLIDSNYQLDRKIRNIGAELGSNVADNGVQVIIPEVKGANDAKTKIDKLSQSLAEADAKFRSFAKAVKTGLLVQAPKIDLIVPVTPKYNLEGASDALTKAVQLQRDQFESETRRIFAEANVTIPPIQFDKIVDFNATNQQLMKMIENVKLVRDTVAGTLTPAFQSLFTAITNNQAPLEAFFKSIQQSIIQLINQLIAAAIKALVLKIITGGGGPTTVGQGIFRTAGNPLQSFGRAGSATSGGLGGVNTRFAGLGGLAIEVTGRTRGNDIVLSGARTSQTQRRGG